MQLGLIAASHISPCLSRLEMGLHGHRERIGGLLQFVPAIPVVAEADHREFQTHRATPAPVTEPSQRFPDRIAQHRQTDHRPVVAVEQSVVVNIHPFGEVAFRLALHLNVDQYPVVLAIPTPHAHQFVRQPPAQFRVPHHLLQLLVEKGVALAPVDPGVRFGKEKGHELREIPLQRGFPGAVVVGHDQANRRVSPAPNALSTHRPHSSGCSAVRPTSSR